MFKNYSIEKILSNAANLLPNSSSPRFDLEILLSHILHKPRAFLYTHSQDILSKIALNIFVKLVKKRQQREPIAYLVGHQPFWNLDLIVSKETLIPRPETELLVEAVLNCLPAKKNYRILDLGTGSGAVALAIACERPNWHILGVDISDAVINIAETNKKRYGLNNVSFEISHWFAELSDRLFDVIVSNPPYLSENDEHLEKESIQFEPKNALVSGHDGLDAIRLIIAKAKYHLSKSGFLILEHGCEQGKVVRALFTERDFSYIRTLEDLADLERVTCGCACRV